jgi:ComF family protein
LFDEIFHPVCVCGERCGSGLLCDDCESRLRGFEHFCEGCGHPVSVGAKVCSFCFGRNWDRLFTDYRYTDPLKGVIKNIKFAYGLRGIPLLGLLVKTDIDLLRGYDAVVAVPTHYSRRLRRFSHPASALAAFIAEETDTAVSRLLVRKKKTGYQWKLKRKQRIKNVKGAFSAAGDCSGRKVLLVDDIYTTGSTVNECAGVLKIQGASKVDVYTLCCSGAY